jgi:hypothetical protein
LRIRASVQSLVGSSLNSRSGFASTRLDLVPRRHYEPHGSVVAAECAAQRQAVLLEREVERGTLEGPAAVVDGSRHRRAVREQLAVVEQPRVRLEGAAAGERQTVRVAVMVGRGIGHVLAAALEAAAAHHDGRRHAGEVVCPAQLEPLEGVALDLEGSDAKRSYRINLSYRQGRPVAGVSPLHVAVVAAVVPTWTRTSRMPPARIELAHAVQETA